MLAAAAARLYASESATWRAIGIVERAIAAARAGGLDRAAAERDAFEQHAVGCAIVKVLTSEMLDAVADTGVQIHGGHGYHRDAVVERAYRDARINRIFEGTNEINRILIASQLFKRATRGTSSLFEDAAAVLANGDALAHECPASDAVEIAERARRLTLFMVGAAHGHLGASLTENQEIAMHIADGTIETFAMEAGVRRAQKMTGSSTPAHDLALAFARDGLRRVARAAEIVVAATAPDAAAAAARLDAVRALAACRPIDEVSLSRTVAGRAIETGKYGL
jgi:hypothetical protein